MKSLETIRKLLHAQWLHIRKCRNIVHNDNFQIAWELASEEEKNEILFTIAEGNNEKLREFMWGKIKSEADHFERLPITKLQEIAKYVEIPYYKQYTKLDLIEEIRKNVTERFEKSCE